MSPRWWFITTNIILLSFAHLEKQVTIRIVQVGLGLQCSYVSQVVTLRNSSCGKAMFIQVSVCPGGDVHPPGKHPNSGQTPPPGWPLQRTVRILLECILVFSYFYRPQRSWGKFMFLHVSVILFTGGVCPPFPAQCMLWDTGNKRAVRILLECNLVTTCQQSCRKAMFSVCPLRSGGGGSMWPVMLWTWQYWVTPSLPTHWIKLLVVSRTRCKRSEHFGKRCVTGSWDPYVNITEPVSMSHCRLFQLVR